MKSRKKICIVTGTRAEYGLLYWISRGIDEHPDLDLSLVVTGMHLAPAFGETWRNIEADGFTIDERVDMLLAGDTPISIAKSTGIGVIGLSTAFERIMPDLVVLLGDRFEILAAATAAMLLNIPIAHIHGGEVTTSTVDESIRHAVTKMAHLHFVSNADSRQRVLQLGELPERVFCVGAPGLDHLALQKLLSREELEKAIGFDLAPPLILVTYHPVTLETRPPENAVQELLDALDFFPEARCLITMANADAGGQRINRVLKEFAATRRDRIHLSTSLGHINYLSALTLSDVVVGNSSSGLIEAPSAGTPTVNIGDRQKGRPRADSVIDCPEEATRIRAAIHRALSQEMQEIASRKINPYGRVGGVSKQIVAEIARQDPGLLRTKPFYDMPPVRPVSNIR